MCTVSWVHDDGGYQLLCNRDEKRTRARATPPIVRIRDGVRFIAPSDGDFGGSWIGVNEFGVSLCLLNGNGPRSGNHKSRGLLLLDLISAQSVDDAVGRTSQTELSVFAPFTLVALEPDLPAAILEWDGKDLAVVLDGDRYMPLISSSFDTDEVRARRRAELDRLVQLKGRLNVDVLELFHKSHGESRDAYSACMHRPDAETVSCSRVKVSDTHIDFFYTPAAPCERVGVQFNALTIPSDCVSHICQ
ncbi:MAG: NRDE family protein [Bryobacteraceae bacterium]